MSVSRGEIVEINFPIPGGPKPHPALVISNNDVYHDEGFFVVAMLSGNPNIDDFSFELTNEMFTRLPKKKTQVRCHMLSIVGEGEITGRFGNIKLTYLNQIVDKICTDILH